MPVRPMKPCRAHRCCALTRDRSGYCEDHAAQGEEAARHARLSAHRAYNERRDESDSFYKTERWKKLSAAYRRAHPVCEQCKAAVSDITDHIKPTKTHPELALDWGNLRALCRPCQTSSARSARVIVPRASSSQADSRSIADVGMCSQADPNRLKCTVLA